MKIAAIFSGRFHPFHRGHRASYDYLCRRYGAKNVYVASSNTTAPITSPFSFEEKTMMMRALKIPKNRIVQVKNPYAPVEITRTLDPETVVVFGVSEKDSTRFSWVKKDGSAGYMQPMRDNVELEPFSKHSYVEIVPTVQFTVLGQPATSASEIRRLYVASPESEQNQIITDLYGEFDPAIKALFDKRLSLAESARQLIRISSNTLFESCAVSRQFNAELVQKIKQQEAEIQKLYQLPL